jgi:hypothetical protein
MHSDCGQPSVSLGGPAGNGGGRCVLRSERRDAMSSEYSVRSAAAPTPKASRAATATGRLIPSRGTRIEFLRFGILVRGTVSFVDERQVLVELGLGQKVSLVPGRDRYRVVAFH